MNGGRCGGFGVAIMSVARLSALLAQERLIRQAVGKTHTFVVVGAWYEGKKQMHQRQKKKKLCAARLSNAGARFV